MASRKTPSTSATAAQRPAPRGRRRRPAPPSPAVQTPAQQVVEPAAPAPAPFPIVAIGASAGGLEALEEFFTHMPPQSGMAFVVVTHQSPTHVSLLPEILGRWSVMPVCEARDGVLLEPNCVYTAPPNRYLSILHATLYLLEASPGADIRLPIDVFFRALAEDQRDRAICVVLSGTGTDGTLGLQTIKAASGMTMVQSEQSARYDGMPHSAVASGLVDYVLAPADMPAQLLAYVQGLHRQTSGPTLAVVPSEVLQKIFLLLRSRTGHDFSGYKGSTSYRRIARRMHVLQLQAAEQYLRLIQEQPHELDLLFRELLIGVTSFFRDPEVFALLEHEPLPQLLASKADYDDIRVWVPGCSSGEEAYSLGILLYECRERVAKRCKVQIFATDLDSQAIEIARTGLYPESISTDIRPDRLARFFTKENHRYRIAAEIRDMVIFAPHNLLADPPFTKLDLLSCRNLLIYLDTGLQKRLLPLFHYALRPHGLLLLGTSETISGFQDLFTVVDKRCKLYLRGDRSGTPLLLGFPALHVEGQTHLAAPPSWVSLSESATTVSALMGKLLVDRYAPPSVIINDQGDIVHIHGRTGTYLEPAPGQPSLNLFAMAREGLHLPLSAAISRAATRDEEVVEDSVQVKTNGDSVRVKVAVQRITAPETIRGLLRVSFQPAADVPALPETAPSGRTRTQAQSRRAALERELQQTREAWQKTSEELHAAYEEFKSTNEEMQSTNEELQSANEELETTKEELQSLNEELQTVNAELHNKVDALSEAQDDMTNLLNSIDLASIFLDNQLRIKRFTAQADQVVKLIQADIGRPLSDIASHLHYSRLIEDAEEVLRTLVAQERQVQAHTGTWYLMRMRPYRTVRNVINGVVITFVDISQLKHAEMLAEAARSYAESIVQTVREALLVLDEHLCVVSANQVFYQTFHESPGNVEQRHIYDLGSGQWNIPRLRELLEDIVPRNHILQGFEVVYDLPHIGRKVMRLNARRLERAPGLPGMILLALEDVTAEHPEGKTC